jgi:ABC-type nitrate/sulfonate/bicarbonate transport system permease component
VSAVSVPRTAAVRSRKRSGTGRRTFTRPQRILITIVNLAAFVVLWEVVATYAGIPSLFLPKFSAIVAEVPEMQREGVLVENIWISAQNYLIGMVISIVLAVPLGLVVGAFRTLDRILSPYLWGIYTTPRIILMPLVLLWVGINDTARIVLVVISAVPATLVVVMEGVRTVDTTLLTAARSFGADRRRLFTHVVFPYTVPFIATGIKMGVSRGLIGLFIGELFTAADGIGFIISQASKQFDSARVYAMLLMFVGFSVAMVGLTRYAERKLSAWRAVPGL